MYIIYVNNTLPLAHEISRHFWAAYDNTTIFKHFQSRDHKMTSLSIRSIVFT